MSWGGAPPWVYKNEAAYAQNDASHARSESRKANEIAIILAEEKKELTKQMHGILSEIAKYQEKKSNNKISKKEMEEILESIKKIVIEPKNNSS